MNAKPVIVSACLVGLNTRYDGTENYTTAVFGKAEILIPVCPEQLGGLPTPRPPAEIIDGNGADVLGTTAKVVDKEGTDVTKKFVAGAKEALKVAKLAGASEAFLKEKSPSCGVTLITRNGKEIKGQGVLASLLSKEGFQIRGF